MALTFELQHRDIHSKARAGEITTDHGTIQTPIFMPVGTVGSVKAISQQDLKNDVEAQIILGNTYHLYLRPGLEILQAAGDCIVLSDGIDPYSPIAEVIRCIPCRVIEKSRKKEWCFNLILMVRGILLLRSE